MCAVRVLVVEDESAVSRLITTALRIEGFEVTTAVNGEDALRQIEHEGGYSVIVLDLLMPVMDGRTFYRKLRALGSELPVLFLSANGATVAQKELDAQDAMPKPFDPFVLVERVRRLAAGFEAPAAAQPS